jgi:hypothetical protein
MNHRLSPTFTGKMTGHEYYQKKMHRVLEPCGLRVSNEAITTKLYNCLFACFCVLLGQRQAQAPQMRTKLSDYMRHNNYVRQELQKIEGEMTDEAWKHVCALQGTPGVMGEVASVIAFSRLYDYDIKVQSGIDKVKYQANTDNVLTLLKFNGNKQNREHCFQIFFFSIRSIRSSLPMKAFAPSAVETHTLHVLPMSLVIG